MLLGLARLLPGTPTTDPTEGGVQIANPFVEVESAEDFKALSIPLDAPNGAEEASYATIGGVLSFGLNADHDTHNRFVSHLKVIPSAVSLGENDERQYLLLAGVP